MKKWLKVLLGIIFFAVLLGLILYAIVRPGNPDDDKRPVSTEPIFPQQTNIQPVAAAQTLEACYRAYLSALDRGLTPDSEEVQRLLAGCLTADAISLRVPASFEAGYDFVLQGQDYSQSWLSNVSTTVQSSNGERTLVRLALGAGIDIHLLDVTLIRETSSWKIDDVQPAD